jgi:hypothetical protein
MQGPSRPAETRKVWAVLENEQIEEVQRLAAERSASRASTLAVVIRHGLARIRDLRAEGRLVA